MSVFTKPSQLVNRINKTLTASLLIIFSCSVCYAQKPLTNSRQSSFYTYIYKLNPEDVLKFYKFPGKDPDENILKNPIDSFKTDKYWENNLPTGNYLKVYAEKNRLEYKLIENHTAWLKLMSDNNDLRFIFLDRQGNVINNVLANVNDKPIAFDSKSGLYNTRYSKKDTLIQVEYAGVTNFFSIKQQNNYYYSRHQNLFVTAWYSVKRRVMRPINYFRYRRPFDHHYAGFMVFNKPKYKPYDTVKFKAFIVDSKSKKPIAAAQLLIRLKEDYEKDGKIIGRVNNYRKGGYEYTFVLSDSLKLRLDEKYTISLEDPSSAKYDLDKYDGDNEDKFLAKRRVYLTGQFEYEDYELKSVNFNMRADKKAHSPGDPLAIYLKATDENGLPVPDGRVELTLTKREVHQYKNKHVFVPDTLWVHKMPLDPVGETKVIIPDSIFPKADIDYEINADFLNSDNEFQSKSETETYTNDKYQIDTRLSGDTLVALYRENGKECRAAAVISALNQADDTISKVKVMLPYRIIINPNVAAYSVETDSAESAIEIGKNENGLSLSGNRTADSLFVTVNNANKLHFWYSVFAGNSLIDEGQADSLFYKRAYSDQANITFIVNYIWGGESKTEQTVVGYADKLLTINVKQPLSVYPGQQVKTDIVVTDATGKPMANTDLTAWSLTSKFSDYHVPEVPYLGNRHSGKRKQKPFDIRNVPTVGSLGLNWNRWSREMGLDSITYYKFTHPDSIYRIEEPANDTVTQVAPFVVKDGDILPIHILYIDNRPVYFSQAQQLQRYSFRVTPGKHTFAFRTDHQSVRIDSMMVEKSKKLIFSVNISAPTNKMHFQKASDTLSYYEEDLINRYMITVENNFSGKMALIQHGENIAFLNPDMSPGNRDGAILTGPITNNYAQFILHGSEKPIWFVTEPKYSYLFEPGLIKQTSTQTAYPFTNILKNITGADDYSQYVLTKNETDTLWQEYLDLRSSTKWLFTNKEIKGGLTGRLNIGLNEGKNTMHPFIKNIIIYRYDNPDYIRVYPGVTVDFGSLEVGKYRLLFLLKGDSYDIVDSISIKPYGVNYYNLDIRSSHPKDSVSIKINAVIVNRTAQFKDADRNIENDALKLKEAFNDKYFDDSGFGSMMSGRVFSADDKSGIPGCSIRIKGTGKGAVTDINGRFRIKVPAFGRLVISFIGYQTKEIPIETRTSVDIKLDPDSRMLSEVNVVSIGYGTVRGDFTGSVQQALEGRAAGVQVTNADASPGGNVSVLIRGVGSMSTNKPLYIVDGLPVENPGDIDPSSIAEISALKDAAATALYGIRAANGVVIITTKKKAAALQSSTNAASQSTNEQSIRKNFSDYAYWQPRLTTDANGKASFTSTFPDDITNWRTFVIGINDQKQSGYVEHQIKSFKPLSANFIAPLFAVQGDELSTIGKVMNYNSDATKVTRSFTYNGKLVKQDDFEVKNAKIDTFKVIAPNTDSLTFEYSIKRDNGYFDGERRKIPVIEQGVKETKGIFEALNGDTTVNMKFDAALGPITFRAEASILPVLAEEAQHLREYKYLCNEQLASKLKGLLAEKRIKKYLGEPFKFERNILEVIKKLQDNRRSQGTWGWWKDTDEELWISLHAVEALTDAQKDGYTIDIDEKKLTDYLVYQLESYKGEEKLACLQLLHKLNAKVDYPKYFGVITKEYAKQKQVAQYDRFRLMLLQEEAGLTVKLDSLLDTEHHTLFGNIYWGEDSYRFFDNSIQLGVLAYKIIKIEGRHPELLEKIRGYFLEQRRLGEWRNTYESSLILETILPDLLKESKQVKPATLIVKGVKADTIRKFPYNATLTDRQLSVSKTGSLPVYITGYQQFWNPKPEKVNKEFTVDTWFEKNSDHLTHLKGGEPVLLKAEVTVKGDADYVMIEIPIPAGCSYESKEQSWQNDEVHREYFKEKVSIFYRKLKQGKYEFTVNLTPRYDGKYNLNPAKAEMMYFPVFYGREGMKSLVIGE